jgi:hypothetical protein
MKVQMTRDMNKLPPAKRVLILHMLCERSSMRSIALTARTGSCSTLTPMRGLPFAQVFAAAHELRQHLEALGLTSLPRTTGGKGMHLVVPIERRHGWSEVRTFAGGLAPQAPPAGHRSTPSTISSRQSRKNLPNGPTVQALTDPSLL